jgi:hypothetical protein
MNGSAGKNVKAAKKAHLRRPPSEENLETAVVDRPSKHHSGSGTGLDHHQLISKSEARNPKQTQEKQIRDLNFKIRNNIAATKPKTEKFQNDKFESGLFGTFWCFFCSFEFVSNFGFRASDLLFSFLGVLCAFAREIRIPL